MVQRYYFQERVAQMKPYDGIFDTKYAQNTNISDFLDDYLEFIKLYDSGGVSNQDIEDKLSDLKFDLE